MKLPRAECPVCHASVATRRRGELHEHHDHRHALYGVPGACHDGRVPYCPASGYSRETLKFARIEGRLVGQRV